MNYQLKTIVHLTVQTNVMSEATDISKDMVVTELLITISQLVNILNVMLLFQKMYTTEFIALKSVAKEKKIQKLL